MNAYYSDLLLLGKDDEFRPGVAFVNEGIKTLDIMPVAGCPEIKGASLGATDLIACIELLCRYFETSELVDVMMICKKIVDERNAEADKKPKEQTDAPQHTPDLTPVIRRLARKDNVCNAQFVRGI